MSEFLKKEDLRIIKTHSALINSMLTLLGNRNFGKLTVRDICEKALCSRAAFYAHFNDKYDLLSYWLSSLKDDFVKHEYTDKLLGEVINQFVNENRKIIRNIVEDSNAEVAELARGFIASVVSEYLQKTNPDNEANNAVLARFCAGGLLNLLIRYVKAGSSAETKLLDDYASEMFLHLINWNSKYR